MFNDSPFSELQLRGLLSPINEARIVPGDAKAGTFPHLAGYDIRAHLNRMFGIGGWSAEKLDHHLIYEKEYVRPAYERFDSRTQKKVQVEASDRVDVAYSASMRVTVYVWERGMDGLNRVEVGRWEDSAVSDSPNQPVSKRASAHDNALKGAITGAIKRCAVNLGDQFGLSLYGRDPLAPIVSYMAVARPDGDGKPVDQQLQNVLTAKKVLSEELSNVPEEERDWVMQAEALAGDESAIRDLWNEARKAKVSIMTSDAIKRFVNALPESFE